MNSPSLTLPACPACSSTLAVKRPVWRCCRNTTKKTGVPTFALVGCEHSNLVSSPALFRNSPELWEMVEAAWEQAVADMFTLKTRGWPVREVERFRRVLDGDTVFEGTIKELNLTPVEPAHEQHKQEKEKS